MTNQPQEKVPFTRHRLFPVTLALWCACLLALGTLAVGTGLLESAVAALRIDRLIPAAAPPLGFTARLLLTGTLGLAGAVGGYLAGRLMARPAAPRAARSSRTMPTSPAGEAPNDDLDRLEAAREGAQLRRRALTTETSHPVPGVLNVAELDALAPIPSADPGPEAAPAPAPLSKSASEPAPGPAIHAAARTPEPLTEAPGLVAGTPFRAGDPQALRVAPLDSLGLAELVERFALALAARRASRPAPVAEAASPLPSPQPATEPEAFLNLAPEPEPEAPFGPEPEPEPAPVAKVATEVPVAPISRPFDMPPSLRTPGLGNVEWFDAEEEEAALESLLPPRRPAPAPFAAPPRGGSDMGDSAADGAAETARWILPEPEDDDPSEEEDAAFSSLLDMKAATRAAAPGETLASFVRIEEDPSAPAKGSAPLAEPVVIFPGQATPPPAIPARLPGAPFGASPAQTEAALREALVALQKMSGTR